MILRFAVDLPDDIEPRLREIAERREVPIERVIGEALILYVVHASLDETLRERKIN
ncbi:hypothetical protein SAMN06297251_1019 [Fulvimarina manganoxydans]|uniref:Ribbon-helix-helix protein, copG family n=1 Tax=Fulvimarina manganoxydans TaxID=937218 RepID=A0A1W1Y809_9HYPH|nr:hypothetical protein [Fulvimarina manganoxydans]SMC32274.1 hypothetical protein SAMN06297251_1019 [Fulvimarina manganoxydans]